MEMRKTKNGSSDVLKINEDYAEKFTYMKKRQALEKAKLKYGKNLDMAESESSDDESEDSDAELINDKVMGKFIETYIKLKDDKLSQEFLTNKDPIFKDEDFVSEKQNLKKKNEKIKFSVNDALLNYKGEDEEGNKTENIFSLDYQTKTIVNDDPEKKEFLRKLNEEAEEGADFEEDGDFIDDGFLKLKPNSSIIVVDDIKGTNDAKEAAEPEVDLENLDLNQVLEKAKIKPKGLDTQLLSNIWGDDKNLDKNERFLRNYILSEAWLDNEENKINRRLVLIDREDEDKDEQFDEFEFKYNHRFEEEGGANITTYQRNIPDSYRIKDDTRSKKRKERELRKEDEKQKFKSELQMAKEIKKEEVKKKLDIIERIAGTDKIREIIGELEDEFDPQKFDEKMNQIFNEEYYGEKDKEEDLGDLIEEKTFDFKTNKNFPEKLEDFDEEQHIQEVVEEAYEELNNEDNGENNEWFYCDECKTAIKENKIKYECEKCPDYLICKDCFKSRSHPHTMKKSKVPLGCKPPANWKELVENNLKDAPEDLVCTTCSNEIINNYYFICSNDECANVVKICKTCRGIGKSIHEHKLTKFLIEQPPEEAEDSSNINPKDKLNNILDTVYSSAPDDIIAKEIPTKFHYTRVDKDELGLTDEMLLYLDDRTLNKHIPLRKLAPYKEKLKLNDWQKKKMMSELTRELERKKTEFNRMNQQAEENKKRTAKFLGKKKTVGKRDDVEDYRKKKRLETYGIEI